MIFTKILKWIARLQLRLSMSCLQNQIHQIFGQIHKRSDGGFPFVTAAQMNKETDLRDIRVLLDLIDRQAPEMGKAYGDAFRYLVYLDIYERLEAYLQHIQPRIPESSRVQSLCV